MHRSGKIITDDERIDVNIKSSYYRISPLHNVCHRGVLEIFNMLIEHPNINIHITDISGDTPLHYACQFGQIEMVKVLLEKGALNVDNICHVKPLTHAHNYMHVEILKFFRDNYHQMFIDNIDDLISNKTYRTELYELYKLHEMNEMDSILNEMNEMNEMDSILNEYRKN